MKFTKSVLLITSLIGSSFGYATGNLNFSLRGHKFDTSNAGRHDFSTGLLLAASAKCLVNDIRFAVGSGANLAATVSTKQSYTALHLAVFNRCTEGVQYLTSLGNFKSTNKPDQHGYTPLHYAARNGDSEIVRHIAESGAALELRSYHDKRTPAELALMNGNEYCVYILEKEIARRKLEAKRIKHRKQLSFEYSRQIHDAIKVKAKQDALDDDQLRAFPNSPWLHDESAGAAPLLCSGREEQKSLEPMPYRPKNSTPPWIKYLRKYRKEQHLVNHR